MMTNKPIRFALLLISSCLFARTGDAAPPVDAAPAFSTEQRRFLSTVARRTMHDALLGRDHFEPRFVPDDLAAMTFEVIVRLRQDGFLRESGVGGPAPIARAVRDASLVAVRGLLDEDATVPSAGLVLRLDHMLIEIEVVGPARRIDRRVDWTRPETIVKIVEPGVHGVMLQAGAQSESTVRMPPSEIFTTDTTVPIAVNALAQRLAKSTSAAEQISLHTFRTTHWYESGSSGSVVPLHRGMSVVHDQELSEAALSRSIDALAEYMRYRQVSSGEFSYEYRPAAGEYTTQDHPTRQAGALSAMALHARRYSDLESATSVDGAIAASLKDLLDVGDGATAFIATKDPNHAVPVTAYLAIALADHPDAARFATTRRKLVSALYHLVDQTGAIATAFPPAPRFSGPQDLSPGLVLLALAKHYEHQPSSHILEAFDRAHRYYRAYFRDKPSPTFVPFQARAFAIMARQTKRQDYIDYVFELVDWMEVFQILPKDTRWPELVGGVAARQAGQPDAETAVMLACFADALRLARRVEDADRARRYERLVRLAARFVVQLQIRPEEAYFITSPQDAAGGIRAAPAACHIRIDHCQHALAGLIEAKRALFEAR